MSVGVELHHVSLNFPEASTPVLFDVSLSIAPGEFVSLVGPSGCGKSTILRLIARLLVPTVGTVRVVRGSETGRGNGEPRDAELAESTSFVFQQPNLLPWRNVFSNVTLPLELNGVNATEARRDAVEACDLVGLRVLDHDKLPRMLSGGMQMRVSIARALVTHPELMLLDEPFAAIDDLLRQQLHGDLLRLWQHQGWTALFVTHHLHEAVYLAQRVIVMSTNPGRIVGEVDVPFPYPRKPELRSSVEFARCLEAVAGILAAGVPGDA